MLSMKGLKFLLEAFHDLISLGEAQRMFYVKERSIAEVGPYF